MAVNELRYTPLSSAKMKRLNKICFGICLFVNWTSELLNIGAIHIFYKY